MRVANHKNSEAPAALISKAAHALGLEQTVPYNDQVYPLGVWETLVETMGRRMKCTKQIIDRAKSQYTYYMLYHYAPAL